MKIIVDEREHALYDRLDARLSSLKTPSFAILEKRVLPLGDILIETDEGKKVMLIERKTYTDLLASIKDGRYEEQSYRLIHSSGYPLHSVVYLLEGLFSQLRTPLEKKIVYSAMTSLHFFKGFSLYKTSTVDETAEWLIFTADKIEREFGKGRIPYYLTQTFAGTLRLREQEDTTDTPNEEQPSGSNYCSVVKKVKKENVTPDNIGEIVLCQIPGISSVTAMAIMSHFTSFNHFMQELQSNPQCIDTFTVTSNGKVRKISKSSLENIRQYLLYTKPVTETTTDTTNDTTTDTD
jgi:ERCC4-type nuclease